MAEARPNPYVGPRPFERDDRSVFFGRDGEARELLSLVVSERVVLLYAASGAGKTSLVHAALVPLLEEEEGFEVLPMGRIQAALGESVLAAARNVYALGLLIALGWDGDGDPPTLRELLAQRPHRDSDGFPAPRALVIDQFEELFTLYPRYWRQRPEFIEELADALDADPLLRVVLAMREDHVAQLDPFADLFPRRLRARFRLERLGPDAAIEAVVNPTRGTSRTYAPGVAEKLVADLLRFRADTGRGETVEIEGEYVEPVQLQVVCESLWDGLPADADEITEDHLRTFGDVDEVLRRFYDRAIRRTAAKARMRESRLRELVERSLITSVGTRSTIYRREQTTGEIPNAAIDELENRHVVRGEWRAGAHWYELTHDRLIDPIQTSNARARAVVARRRRRRGAVVGIALAAAAIAAAVLLWPSAKPEPHSPLSVPAMALNVSFPRGGTANVYYVDFTPEEPIRVGEGEETSRNVMFLFSSVIDVRTGAVSATSRAKVNTGGSRNLFRIDLPVPRRRGAYQVTVLARRLDAKVVGTAVSPSFVVARAGGPAQPLRAATTLNVQRVGAGEVAIVAQGRSARQTCPPACTFVLASSGAADLTAKPAPGWRFVRWTGCGQARASCEVDVSGHVAVRASFAPVPRTITIGTSTKGKPVKMTALGDPGAKRKVLVVACSRPSECGGQTVADTLLRKAPPVDTELLVVRDLNPDGLGDTIDGTSPNKAFPCHGKADDVYTHDCRVHRLPWTPEAKAIAAVIVRERPKLTLWYFQRTPITRETRPDIAKVKRDYPKWVNRVGNDRAVAIERRFAKAIDYPLEGRDLPLEPKGGYPSNPTYWQVHRYKNDVAFWVELPVGALSQAAAERHADAILAAGREA